MTFKVSIDGKALTEDDCYHYQNTGLYPAGWTAADFRFAIATLAISSIKAGPMGTAPEAAITATELAMRHAAEFGPTVRDAIIEDCAQAVDAMPLTYAGPDPHGVRNLKYLLVAAIRDLKGHKPTPQKESP